jgi:23S rRNA (cytosine1962-C5)-methyltransferase
MFFMGYLLCERVCPRVLPGRIPKPIEPAYAATVMNGSSGGKFRDPSLIDFGTDQAGNPRRLELLGSVLVDRPLAQDALPGRRLPAAWREAGAIFHAAEDGRGRWEFPAPLPDPWLVRVPLGKESTAATLALEVRPAPSGQIGVFLEQVEQWRWLADVTRPGARMLSLFAHSGAATLALAAAGAEVVHVDASKQATAMARRNAEASGLGAAPIRWICEDARAFVAREVRRGIAYDGFVADPPSWGHGPKGQAFAIDRDLVPLLADLAVLLGRSRGSGRPGPVLLTCHSPRWHHRRLHDTLADALGEPASSTIESGRLACIDASGRSLPLGDYVRQPPTR